MAKELLWLDADEQVIAATMQASYAIPGPHPLVIAPDGNLLRIPDQLVVQLALEEPNLVSFSRCFWVFDEGNLTQYFATKWEYFPVRYSQEITLLPDGDPDPVPIAILRYVETYETSEH